PTCGCGLEELEPRTFSFNSPHGACPECDGLGTQSRFDPDLVVPDRSLSLAQGAVLSWQTRGGKPGAAESDDPWVKPFLKRHHLKRTTPLASWPPGMLDAFLNGGGERDGATIGVLPALERAYKTARTLRQRSELDAFRSAEPCPACAGARLRPEARGVKVGG